MLTKEQRMEISAKVKELELADKKNRRLYTRKSVLKEKKITPSHEQYDFIKNPWELRLSALTALKCIRKYAFYEGDSHTNRHIRLWLNIDDAPKFTPSIHNALRRAVSNYYGGIVIIEYKYSASNKKKSSEPPLIEISEEFLPF